MNLRTPLALTLVTASLLAATGCGKKAVETPVAAVTPVLVETARRGSLEDLVNLTGNAEADKDTTLMPEIGGNIAAVYVRIGDRVSAGQALVRLDSTLAAAQESQSAALVRSAQARYTQAGVNVRLTDESTAIAVRQAQTQLQSAQEQLEKAKRGYELVKTQVETTIQQARTGVATAQANLADIKAGARSQEIAQAQAALDSAESALRLSESNYHRSKQLMEAGAISAQALDAARTDYEAALARREQARQALSLAQAGARTGQVQVAELAVQQAQQQLQLAEAGRDQIYIAQRDVNTAEAGVQQARENLNLAQQQRRQLQIQQEERKAAAAAVGQAQAGRALAGATVYKHVVRAPFAGRIAERMVDPGTGAGTATPLLRLVSLQPMKVRAEVSELQVPRLRVGMPATVTVDALPGRTFAARLARLSPAAGSAARVYVAELSVDNRQELIKPGMFCRASIVLQTVPDAVIVSRDTLVENGPIKQVYVVENGKVAIREVVLGAANDSSVQILSGVKPGDKLVRSGQTLLAKGQAVQPTERGAGAAAVAAATAATQTAASRPATGSAPGGAAPR